MTDRTPRLGAFLHATGHHVAAWLHPDAQADAGHNLDHYKALVRTAERGRLDLVFVADSPGGYADFAEPDTFRQNAKAAHFEPLTLWAALAQVTERIGFVAASTTYEDPYTTARKFASLDWISGGRAGWNVVTTGADVSANFSAPAHLEHARRYELAEEYIDVVKGLWDSYDDDAFVRDRARGVFLERDRFHLLGHQGRHFQLRGPLNIARPPQGYPVIVQAGASEPERELAARTAEVIFTANLTLADAQDFYRDVKARLPRYGRRAEDLLVMPGIFAALAGDQRHIVAAPLLLIWLIDFDRPTRLGAAAGMSPDALDYTESLLPGAVDSAMAAQNAVVAVEALGLGSVHVGGIRNAPLGVAAELDLPPRLFPLFGLLVGRPDPARPAAIRPRLPQDAVLYRERYRWTAASARAATRYDARLRTFQRDQGMPQADWTQLALRRTAGPPAMSGRHTIRESLARHGFPLL